MLKSTPWIKFIKLKFKRSGSTKSREVVQLSQEKWFN